MSLPSTHSSWIIAAALVTLCSPVFAASPANTSAKKAIDPLFTTIDAPLDPTNPLARRLKHHAREAGAHRWGAHPGEKPAQLQTLGASVVAAEYAHAPKSTWQIAHQDVTIDTDAAKSRLAVQLAVTVRTKAKGVTELTFRTDVIEKVVVKDSAGNPLTATYKKSQPSVGLLTVKLPGALTPTVDHVLEVSYEAQLDCNAKGYRLRPCNFDATYASVAFFRYYLGHGQVVRHPFTSDLHIITAHDRKAAAPGIPQGASKLSDGRLSWHFKQPERTQNAGYSIAKYGVSGDDPNAGIGITGPYVQVYSQGDYAKNGNALVQLMREAIKFQGERFGSFPWAGLNVIQMAKNFGGGYAPLSGIFMVEYVFATKSGGQGWIGTV